MCAQGTFLRHLGPERARRSALWVSSVEIGEGLFDVAFCGEPDCVSGVVPVEVDSNVSVIFPVRFHGVVITDDFFKV